MKYFKDKKIRIFHDKETRKVGLKPDIEGYKIYEGNHSRRISCHPLARIVIGEYYPKWSKEHKMLIFSY